ncbi:MAG: acylphosphatase [Acidobacteriota bacterium]|nr:acylphosphatase [Acidobacteriota bacterium]
MSPRVRAAFRVTGRVQGVGFRWWAEAQAQALGLAGFVRNDPDGAVSGWAEGEAAAMAAFRSRLVEGPSSARVADVAWDVDAGQETGSQSLPFPFEIHR